MTEQELFLDVLRIADPAERAARLHEACAGDLALEERVRILLHAHDRGGHFLDAPAAPLATIDFPRIAEGPGATIGPYKLLQQIGEGGFGVVYMAEQHEPVRRKVALKIIKPGMDTREVIARFESERQALALMDHPNIARVLDAGATASGRPYFVMELVKGLSITEFADKNRLTVEQRLPMFVDVCRAVQHAHQKGVIHRDLKPTNVMVTLHDGRPVVKVIDFGVAKATSQQLTQRTLFTAYGQMIGTPAYMSPEQAEMSGLDIDTRTDIYSLGVLLYELLTGTTPLELERLRAAGFAEMQRLIREEEPQRPSTRFSTLGAQATALANSRGTDVKRLGQFLRGDLDWIVMKSLEKDRNRRYETPGAFAADIERFLNHDAIAARPPSAAYRFRKLVRRNAVAFAVASACAAVSAIGGAVSTIFGIQATQQAARAVKAEQSAQQNLIEAEQKGRFLASAKEELRATLYAAEMNLVQSAWEDRQYDRVSDLLNQQRPPAGLKDLRGWEWRHWRRRLARGLLRSVEVPELKRLEASFTLLGAPLAFTSDGERLAAILQPPPSDSGATGHMSFAVFDAVTGRLLNEFELPPERENEDVPSALSLSNDGGRFVHISKRGASSQTVVRDGRAGEKVALLERLELRNPFLSTSTVGPNAEVTISPDGALVVEVYGSTASDSVYERTVAVSDAATGERKLELPPAQGTFVRAFWSADAKQLLRQTSISDGEANKASTDGRHEFQLFDASTGEKLWSRTEELTSRQFRNLHPRAWSPDGRLIAMTLAIPEEEARMELWDAQTGKTLATLTLPVQSVLRDPNVAFSPDSRTLAHGASNEIHVWDLPQLARDAAEPVALGAPSLTIPNTHGRLRALAFSRDGREIRAATAAAITTWDATLRDKSNAEFPQGYDLAIFTPDANRLAILEDNAVSIRDSMSHQRICTLPLDGGDDDRLGAESMMFSPDGRQLAVGMKSFGRNRQSRISLYDAQEGRLLANFAVDASADQPGIWPVAVPVVFRPDGAQMARVELPTPESGGPAKLRVWDTKSFAELPPVDLPWSEGALQGYSADGATLYVSENTGGAGEVACIDASTRELRKILKFPHEVHVAYPLHDLVGVRDDGDLVFHDLTTGSERVRLQGLEASGVQLAITPDGRRLAAGVVRIGWLDAPIVVWSLDSGRRVLSLKGPDYLGPLAFSGDGRRLLARANDWPADRPSQIWDATPLPEADSP